MDTAFGSILKDWRSQRRMSQLDLGLSANVSARHISFLETGRSRPSRSMVLQLCEELDVPRQARNQFLAAAGLAPAYASRDLADADMEPARAAMEWMLARHDPYPAMAIDRHWTLLKMNRTSALMLGGLGIMEGGSMLDALTDNDAVIDALENWDEVARHAVTRLRTESAHLGGDPVLDQAAERIAGKLGRSAPPRDTVLPAFIPARYRANGVVLSLFSTVAQFGSAEDIALAEIKIEMMFPADEATRKVLVSMGADCPA